MNVFRIIGAIMVFMLSAGLCFGQDSSGIKITPNGWAAAEFGQVVSGFDKHVGDISHVAIDRIYLGTGANVVFSDRTKFTGKFEVKAFNEFPRQVIDGFTRRYYYYFYLTQAEVIHRLINSDALHLDIGGGYFPYKYDNDARDLGEYLFRSTAYPQTLTTEFDFPFARLAGVYARSAYSAGENRINFDLLFTINTEWMAIGDLNMSMIASYNFARIFEIGAGVEFGSIISADENATTPKNNSTQYLIQNADGTIDTSQNYTFRGTKVMGRFSIDPKKIIPFKVFGGQDLKIYGEATLLGVKNYELALHSPVWYNSILERIPVMLGFNFPAFKLLDVLSLQGEWWGNRYPNSMEGIVNDGLPLPFRPGVGTIDSTKYKNDNLKWSVFGEKTFWGHYRLSFQVASDHMRTFAWDWDRQDWEESLRGPKKWYYMVRFGFLF